MIFSAFLHLLVSELAHAQIRNLSPNLQNLVISTCKPGMAALTFDDGPLGSTADFLKVLKEENVTGTFFVVGLQINANKPMLKNIVQGGHQVAIRSFKNQDFLNYTVSELKSELKSIEDIIFEQVSLKPRFIRIPFGRFSDQIVETVTEAGYRIIRFNLQTADFEQDKTAKKIVGVYEDFFKNNTAANNGLISIHHDFAVESAKALRDIIRKTREQGFKLVNIADCIGDNDGPYKTALGARNGTTT